MSTFFTFRSSSSPVAIRALVGIGIVFLGVIAYLITIFTSYVRYTTANYYDFLLREWTIAAKPIFFSLVPALFFTFLEFFPRISWKLLIGYSLIGGILIALPRYIHIIRLWQPMVQIVSDLPVSEVKYHRNTATLSSHARMMITFIITDEYYPEAEQVIKTRIAKRKGPTSEYWYEIDKQTPGRIEASLNRTKL